MKKCKTCKKPFQPFNSLAAVCSVACAIVLVEKKKEKEFQVKKKVFRENDKTLPKLRAEAQKAVNAYIRARDAKKPCISCGSFSSENDAGHFRSRGSARHLAFNLFNIHKQCKYCNRHLGGNYSEYRKGIIKRIGIERVERLDNDNEVRKFDKEYLERVKKIFNKRERHIRKLIELRK